MGPSEYKLLHAGDENYDSVLFFINIDYVFLKHMYKLLQNEGS